MFVFVYEIIYSILLKKKYLFCHLKKRLCVKILIECLNIEYNINSIKNIYYNINV